MHEQKLLKVKHQRTNNIHTNTQKKPPIKIYYCLTEFNLITTLMNIKKTTFIIYLWRMDGNLQTCEYHRMPKMIVIKWKELKQNFRAIKKIILLIYQIF